MTAFYAHSSPDGGPPPLGWQLLADHLKGVAELARRFAEAASPHDLSFADAAYFAGLFHDVGKYRPEFQQMLLGQHPKNQATWHKQAGAAAAANHGRLDIAFAIAGHHGGLPDFADLKELVHGPNGRAVFEAIRGSAIADLPDLTGTPAAWQRGTDSLLFDLLVRMLFSCLVDADWKDTNDFERRAKRLPPETDASPLNAAAALGNVLSYIRQRAQQCRDARVAAIRQEILDAALQVADRPPGLFTMTVPTGGGKTLSGLAFALAHAHRHGLRRIIYVAPYLTIIEQNAREIRRALQVDDHSQFVLEHHSLAEPPGGPNPNEPGSTDSARRAENWDAPIIITTSVQFYESLFSHRPGQCRKLHNIARSVVILDECQTLPPDLVAPTSSMLGQLAQVAGCSIVLCTATQPAWSKRPELPEGLDGLTEIVPLGLNLFERLRRVKVEWPGAQPAALEWAEVADRMTREKAALCVVNTRKAARDLFRHLRELGRDDALHLSTTMCPAHRLEVIDEVHRRLDTRPCLLVSTQLIECGCDVDFPVVLREIAPLESIIQSAGRCNREGTLNAPDGTPGGRVIVFRSRDGGLPKDRWYRAGRDKVEQDFLAMGRPPDISRPEHISEYFHRLYRSGALDQHHIQHDRTGRRFASAASKYRVIDDDTVPVVVTTWEHRQAEIDDLLERLRRHPSKALFRRLGLLQVNLRTYELADTIGSVAEHPSGVKIWTGPYDMELGVLPGNPDVALVL